MSLFRLPSNFLLRALGASVDDSDDDGQGDVGIPDGFHEVSAAELARDPSAEPPPIDYAPFIDAVRQASGWFLDVARARTTDPVDLAAIDRVQHAMRATFAGAPPCARGAASEEDVLVVLGILVSAFEVDFGLPGLGDLVGSLYDATDGGNGHGGVPARRATRVLPIVVRRRPRIAHGFDDLGGGARRVVIIR